MIEVGFYKVKKEYIHGARFHYLRVFYRDKKLFYQEDHSIEVPLDDQDRLDHLMDGLTILKKITTHCPPQYNNIEVIVSFKDEDGDSFEMNARSYTVLNKIFEFFPRLLRAFKP